MNTGIITDKRRYIHPDVICVSLDNEISLALESNPPDGPGETMNFIPAMDSNPIHDCIV